MVIREMSKKECLRKLTGARLARLACSRENQPYVVPVYLACDEASGCLYGFTTPGQKIEWMRANPRVCVEVDEVVFLDIELPILNGYEVAIRLRQQPGLENVLLVATTGHAEEAIQCDARDAGFDTHLAKPYQVDTVLRFLTHGQPGGYSVPRGLAPSAGRCKVGQTGLRA